MQTLRETDSTMGLSAPINIEDLLESCDLTRYGDRSMTSKSFGEMLEAKVS